LANLELSGEAAFIENDLLKQQATLDVTDSTSSTSSTSSKLIKEIKDWKGVGYLTGLTEANFSGIEMTYDILKNFTSVQKLTLQNCKLTEDTFYVETTDETTNEKTKSYLKLESLRELDVRNNYSEGTDDNAIKTFDWLTTVNFPSLEKAHITGNETDNDYLGNTGLSNYYIFEELTRDGVTVYNDTNTNNVEIPFADSTDLNDYVRLKSLAYQSIIAKNADITKSYKEFKDYTLSDFGLSTTTYDTLTWGYGGGTSETDATYFSVTVTTQSTIGNYSIIVRYYVDRRAS